MSANDRKNTNKTGAKTETGSPPPEKKVKPGMVTAANPENGQKAKKRKPKVVSVPTPNQLGAENPASEIETLPIANPPAGRHGSKLQTEEMEVHHHPQLHHKPKPWKEYLLEGFMIFIAVMMGFIAENIREDLSNREQVRQLTSQLVQDLKADTVRLNQIYTADSLILKANDSLFYLLQQPLAKVNTKKIQLLVKASHNFWPFHPSGGAIGAIKNELHLKQLSNSKIIGYIAMYEGHIELLHTVQDITLQYQRSFLDPFLRFHFTPANLDAIFNSSAGPGAEMRNLTQNDLTQLATDMVLVRVNTWELKRDDRQLKEDAVDLLNYVKKQYGVEGE